MTTQNLIGLERAKLNCNGATTSDDRVIDVLVGACSDAIVKWCRRDFAVRAYDELYSGNGDRRLLLRSYPLISVEAVRYRPVTVLKVSNSSTSVNQQARVTVTASGLTLLRVASGVQVLDTSITWATYPTLQGVATAITALGSGWTAQVVGDVAGSYGLWASSDLYVPPSYGTGTNSQGALACLSGGGGPSFAELKMHTYELQGYQWDPRGWLLRAIPYTDPELMHPEDLVWPTGVNNFRIQYTAGYPEIPQAVQEACASWVAERWAATKRDPGLTTLTSAPSGGTATAQVWGTYGVGADTSGAPPAHVVTLLRPWRRFSISTGQG